MPLGSNVGANIRELVHHGSRPRSRKQIIAIAMNAARRGKRSKQRSPRRKRPRY
jgi:hypothetical protein